MSLKQNLLAFEEYFGKPRARLSVPTGSANRRGGRGSSRTDPARAEGERKPIVSKT